MKRIQLKNREDLASNIPLESPWVIFIDPSSVCNFSCKFCMNSKIKNPKIMDFELYKQIIDDLIVFKKPVKVIRLYGFGEPLVNKNFACMVKYAKQSPKVLSVDTTTNASLLNKKLNENIIESGIDRINISIEAMSTEKYREFTGNKKVNFQEIVDNISHLYKGRGKTIIFAKIAGDYLTDEEKDKFFEVFTPITDGCDIEYNMNCWYDLDFKESNKKVGVYGQPLENVQTCPYVFYSMMIQPDGTVSVCFLDWNKKMIIGDLNTQTVQEIWNNDKFNKFRLNMLKGIKNKICSNCDQLKAGMPVNLDPHLDELLKRIEK